jgi:hypothetical protein
MASGYGSRCMLKEQEYPAPEKWSIDREAGNCFSGRSSTVAIAALLLKSILYSQLRS